MAQPTQNDPQFKLRLPAELKERVQSAAERSNRSMNAEIVATLEEKYPALSRGISELIQELRDKMESAENPETYSAAKKSLHSLAVALEGVGYPPPANHDPAPIGTRKGEAKR